MMKNFIRKNVSKKKVLTLALVMLAMTPMLAQGGATAISNAASDIKDYWDPIKLILKAVGGLVGFIGGLRVYNKWTNGDQDVKKTIMLTIGGCIAFIALSEALPLFFK